MKRGKRDINRLMICAAFILIAASVVNAQSVPKREMRGVWIATVENIDWPSSPALTVAAQQKEMAELLDLVKAYNLNTVILQIRPAADAFYQSNIEPWSVWLTGEQGKAPEPFYDPLEFTISECRKRGLDIHVWLNPYRAIRDTAKNSVCAAHITNTHPELFVTYGSTVYFDPGLPETRDYVTRVTCDIVRRYNIDAIHMDDYFYPYRIAGQSFPDDSSFAVYHGSYTEKQRDAWRRNNVDLIIQQVHDSIMAIKPCVQFGISPFGVWRNSDRDTLGSATRAGQTNYDDLYADILKWQREGWIDYVVPQLYWQIGMKIADYAVLADWWNKNTYGCPLYIGQAFYRINPKSDIKAWQSSDEIIRQIELNRSLSHIKGSVYFSAKYLRSDPGGLKKNLKKHAYSFRALPPENSGISSVAAACPGKPVWTVVHDTICLTWLEGNHVKYYVIYKFRKGKPADITQSRNIIELIPAPPYKIRSGRKTKPGKYYYAVTALSQTNAESERALFIKAE